MVLKYCYRGKQDTYESRWDIVIIGAGVAGLTASDAAIVRLETTVFIGFYLVRNPDKL
jgi:ribulose 1,5-bisphosphate synthetase/thiazole synthase